MVFLVDDPAALPAVSGAYVLVLDLLRPLSLPDGHTLDPGRYAYAGSARGPGGIRARVGRHVRPGKTVHWHIDRLTGTAGVLAAAALPDATECAAADFLRDSFGGTTPAPGFGSSDCRRCPSHLVLMADGFEVTDAAQTFATATGTSPPVIWRSSPAACFRRPPPMPT